MLKNKRLIREALDEFLEAMRKAPQDTADSRAWAEQDYIYEDAERALDKAYGVSK